MCPVALWGELDLTPSFSGGAQVRPLPWESGVGIGIAVLGCLFISWDSVLGARSR